MREIINSLNKKTLSESTGISYSRLRKFSSGSLKELTPEECHKIYEYLISISNYFLKPNYQGGN